MAQFDDKNLRLPQAGSPLGYSQGIDRAKGNEGFETLFKGLGSAVTSIVTTADETIKSDIDNQLYKGIDAIRGEQGVDNAVIAANTPALIPASSDPTKDGTANRTPPALDSATNEITRLQNAYKDGKIGDTQYWSKVESLTRQVRARYPGYREEIDKRVSAITGTTPANALRKSLLEEMEADRKKQASKADDAEKFVRTNQKYLGPASLEKFNSGARDPVSMSQYQKEIGEAQANEHVNQSARNDLALKDAQRKATTEEAGSVLTSDLNTQVTSAMNSGFEAGGVSNGSQLMQKIQQAALNSAKGIALKPEEQQAITGQFAAFKLQVESQLRRVVNTPLQKGARSYAAILNNPTAVENYIQTAMAPINDMEKAITNGDYGTLAINANAVKAMQNADQRKVLESSEFARKFQAAKSILGDAGTGVFLNQNTAQLSEFSQTLERLNLSQTVIGEGTILDQYKKVIENSPKVNGVARPDPKAVNSLIDSTTRLVSDPKTNDQALANAATVLFQKGSTDELKLFNGPAQQARVFAKFTAPEVTKNMLRLKSSQPQLWEAYKNWASTNFVSMNGQLITDISKPEMGVSIAVDGTGKIRIVEMRGTRPEDSSNNPIAVATRARELQQANARLQNFNLGVDTLAGIYKQEGIDIKEALAPVYKQMGLTTGEDKESGNGSGQKGEAQKQSLNFNSLGNQVQLAAFNLDDNSVPGRRDGPAPQIDLDATPIEGGIDLDAPSYSPIDDRTGAALAQGTYAPVLNLIGRAEAPRGYNQIFGRGREAPLTQMTISEVFDLQRRMVNSGSESSALGRYQFINDTLRAVVKQAGLDPNTTKFTPEVQDKLAVMLMEGRGLSRYLRGEISEDRFANNLAQEWAGFPLANGRSYYAGVGSNKATISREELIKMIRGLKNEAR